ncbi:metal-sensing transcriptional repressor [Cohnella luojiensis]|uniref:Metal-sensing transcriptional repressor n=2 Tax=Cohnella luojiensis TaxID=652876 RepID=A0A4Y8M0M1_9BACL|nr:metal-sensing transcriptional repressor [Cohnella luojiensis]
MMEEEKHCREVVAQISAIRSAADKAIAYIVAKYLEQCILEVKETGRHTSKVVVEAVQLIIKSE